MKNELSSCEENKPTLMMIMILIIW